jgi:hypothetical protein
VELKVSKRSSIFFHDNNLESRCNSELTSEIMNHEDTYAGSSPRKRDRSILRPLYIRI